ncbi:EpsG family protein [Vagococcus fluvialis]|uniref:EpsG family protein n=1 Tax=Vagococcus fluvialis TaxID=2738 RepID=UPI0029CAB103|nr:EpsG family protein [Vagococcus fluvialis]UDM73875.1 EpsG family protein [Vagococcus fluvialis]
MSIYISIFICLLTMYLYDIVLVHYYKINSKLFKILGLLLLFAFLAFRFDNGWDYMAYYNTIQFNMLTNIVDRGELLTILFVDISQNLKLPFLFFILNAVIQIFCIGKVLIKNDFHIFWLGIFLYISFPLFYLNSFSVIRMFTAVSILFFSYEYLYKNKYLKFILLVVVAALFHKSAIIGMLFIIIPFINKVRINNLWFIFSIPLIRFLAFAITTKKFPEYLVYFERSSNQEGTKAIIVFILIFILLVFCNSIIKKDDYFYFQSKIFSIGMMIYITFFGLGTLSHRFSLFGTITSLVIVGKLIELSPKKYKFIIIFIYILLCLSMYIFTIKIGQETYIPYKTIFSVE